MTTQNDQDSWSMVDFISPTSLSEVVSDALWSLGVVAIEERHHSNETVVLRTSMGEDPFASAVQVSEIFPDVTFSVVHVPRAVADTWRNHATATPVTDSLDLVPAWVTPASGREFLLIEPLDTFGLGNHPTTVLALRLALRTTKENSRVFDLGCGSGVLAVGVAKFLKCDVLAYDIADNAREAVRINCELNDVSSVQWHEGIRGTQSEVVLANILAPVLIEESTSILDAVFNDGTIVLSGMREEQVPRVLAHFENCVEIARDSLEGWSAVVLKKN